MLNSNCHRGLNWNAPKFCTFAAREAQCFRLFGDDAELTGCGNQEIQNPRKTAF